MKSLLVFVYWLNTLDVCVFSNEDGNGQLDYRMLSNLTTNEWVTKKAVLFSTNKIYKSQNASE